MKKNITIERVINVYKALDGAKMSKLETSDRYLLIRALRPMRRIDADFAEFREDAVKRLRPDNYDDIAAKVNKFNALKTVEEREAAIEDTATREALEANYKFNTEVSECVKDELGREVELEFAPLSEDAFGKLMESNPDWALGLIAEIEDVLTENKE